jgi:tetratricopeptide (TPR) repeat protein
LHERAGQALEAMFADQLDDHLGQLAHHYRHSDNVGKAVEYLGRAAQQAMRRSAHAEAIDSLSAAIDLLHKLPDSPERIHRELPLQLALGSALIAVNGWAALEVERAFTRARELCGRRGDSPELFAALIGLWAMHYQRAELRTAFALAEQLLRRAQNADNPTLLMLSHIAMGISSVHIGQLLPGRKYLEKALSLYRECQRPLDFRFGGMNAGVHCLSYTAFTLWNLGYPDHALKRGNEGVALAQGLSDPFSLPFAEYFLGLVRLTRGDTCAVHQTAQRLIALAAEHGFPFWLPRSVSEK